MNYYNTNYDQLKRLPQYSFHIIIIWIIMMFIIFIVIACNITIDKKIECYGFINDNLLIIEIKEELSDIIKNNNELIFNNEKTKYNIISFGNYSYVENKIFEEIKLVIDAHVYDNEVGLVTINYDKQKLINYIFELFK